jgi:2-polyprenyl-3-methyl-5-hydroxy-6-metoxy-1,4-benzoquinol methylase
MIHKVQNLAYRLWERGYENAAYYKTLATHAYRLDQTVDKIFEVLGDDRKFTLLDVGTGCGSIPLMVGLSLTGYGGFICKGVDKSSLYMAQRSLNMLPELNGKVVFESKSIFDLKEAFDYVTCTEVLEHLENWEEALEILKSITKKKLLISVPNERSGFCEGHYRNYKNGDLEKLGKITDGGNHWTFVEITKGGVNGA